MSEHSHVPDEAHLGSNELLHAERERNPEENCRMTPPEDERIETHCIWVAECYTPSHVDGFLSGIKKLGWDRRDQALFEGEISSWFKQYRGSTSSGGTLYLGLILRPDAELPLGSWGARRAELPEGVDRAYGFLRSMSSSLTIFTVQFVLKDDAAGKLDASLREREEFRARKEEGLISLIYQKQIVVREAREELRKTCSSWLKENVPGLFSSEALGGSFPTCEFITLDRARPFERPPDDHTNEYLRLLNMDNDLGAWKSGERPNLRLEVPQLLEEEEAALTIAGKKDEMLFDDEEVSVQGSGRVGLVQELYLPIGMVLTVWSLHILLRAYERVLAELRDRAAAIDVREPTDAMKDLQSLQTDLVKISNDLIPLSPELASLCAEANYFRYNTPEFEPANKEVPRMKTRLIEGIREDLLRRSLQLREVEGAVRQAVMTNGSVVSTISQEHATQENLRLQGRLNRLTWVLVALTTVLVVLTIVLVLQ